MGAAQSKRSKSSKSSSNGTSTQRSSLSSGTNTGRPASQVQRRTSSYESAATVASTSRTRTLSSTSHKKPVVSMLSSSKSSIDNLHQYQHQYHSTSVAVERPRIAEREHRSEETIMCSKDDYIAAVGVQTETSLPDDWDLQDRFFTAHQAIKKLFGSNVTETVRPKLVPGACIVEIGCGNGPWIIDTATQYPHCQFIGIEVPKESPPPPSIALPNVQFQFIESFEDKLPLPSQSVDAIHMRAMSFRLWKRSWPALIREIQRVLKPGGVLETIEAHFNPSGSMMIESFVQTLRSICKRFGQDYDFSSKVGEYLDNAGMHVVFKQREVVHLGSDGKLAEEFIAILLRSFEIVHPVFAPIMGLDHEDYIQRVETVCSQCVSCNSTFEWFAFAAINP
ncbi:hypothetical protein VTP01DRAFT_6507 [Rhizomucor pusillus]|uniref:uncharacterized protein n=1 Tax=Rhizomucor pusillus TaxID=4840 RepID=UPI003742C7BF